MPFEFIHSANIFLTLPVCQVAMLKLGMNYDDTDIAFKAYSLMFE